MQKAAGFALRSFRCHHPNPPFSNPSSLLHEFTEFCYQKNLPKAMESMDTLHKHNLYADPVTYSLLIKSCLSNGAVQHAKCIHNHIFSSGYHPETFLVNMVLNMYVKFGMLDEALEVFDKMPERNVVSWTTMISGYSNVKLNRKALEFLVFMFRDGVEPNRFTYSSVLRACVGLISVKQIHGSIVRRGLESDDYVRSALIDIYSKWGELGSALCVFNEFETCDLVVWNSIIAGFAQNSDGDEALEFFKSMKRSGLEGNQAALTSVLRACTGLTLLELGKQVHVHVLKFKGQQDLILENALLDMYCKCGSLEDANILFGRMVVKDVISWSTMISGLGQNGYSREALKLFDGMKVSETKPNYITLLGVLFACSHAGLLEDGWYYFRSMKKLFGIDPGREHYGCMIDLLGRAGKLEDAIRLINEMESEPDAVTWRTLLGACRMHHNMDLAIHAAKQIIKLDPQDAGTYILLSNIYAKTQRWDDVAEIRRTMNAIGIKKEPGCSWVEVNKQIHAFTLEDNSHPQLNEINKLVNELIRKLREMGYVPDTNFVLRNIEGDEQREDSLRYHSEKLALAFGMMSLSKGQIIRIRKNLRICGDCHLFAKLVSKMENRVIVIRDPIRYHHFRDGTCSCGDYW
ncbi:Pentatricopeptide repeat (PPR) superfamily protein [Euphorbia peplus]|nr:Pentatricopeptide repeat (PPR) superfamily protein [Euphorbia peplus]